MNELKIFNVKWTSTSAGPSLDNNKRTEIFLAGCKKAREGNPCKGCFNQELWSKNVYRGKCTPQEAFKNIQKFAPNKYITFVGGEPLDQLTALSELCELLKRENYHIIIITHYKIQSFMDNLLYLSQAHHRLIRNVDVFIDGEYDETLRIWDEDKAGDGLHDVIGSGNQLIWDFHRFYTTGEALWPVPAGELEGMFMNRKKNLVFITKDERAVATTAEKRGAVA